MRWIALFPLACAIPSFILTILCLVAGSKQGYMEDYNVMTVRLNS